MASLATRQAPVETGPNHLPGFPGIRIPLKVLQAPIELGRYASDEYSTDPKHLAFVASRYKFIAKMLAGKGTVLEIGCGDGFGAPIVADAVDKLVLTDVNAPMLDDVARRQHFVKNLACEYFDFREKPRTPPSDAAYLVDVIEHIYPNEEAVFMKNVAASIADHGVLLIGTPNETSGQYASEWSRKAHINLKTHEALRDLGRKHFRNVFMFGMNDEVLHTGYAPMCHYLWALCVAPKR